MDDDLRFRLEAFAYLDRLTRGEDEVPVHWKDLQAFRFEGQRAPLIGQRGIWKPACLGLPISIATTPPKAGRPAPYDDEIQSDDTILYRYQGKDPQASDNVGLRRVLFEKRPLVYFHGIEKGVYMAAWPIHVVADHPERLAVTVALSPISSVAHRVAEEDVLERRYRFSPARRRLHQTQFRIRVLRAYQRRCAICKLGHDSLLDAAHILPDCDDRGVATVSNGLTLCKIHHAAYDGNILGIDPDYRIHVREDVLDEIDGPMLEHGIKELHERPLLVLPKREGDRPAREFLEERFDHFRRAR